MSISQFFILSQRGERILFKSFRDDVPRTADAIFFRKYTAFDGKLNRAPAGDCPPFFTADGINFCFLKRRKVFLVCTTRDNVSPSTLAELLTAIWRVIKDYLGEASEDAIRRNFTLVYELVDEMIDMGLPQEMSTARVRPFIAHEARDVHARKVRESIYDRIARGDYANQFKSSESTVTSVMSAENTKENDLFVDVLERLSVCFNPQGGAVAAEVDGAIIAKSFLTGSPTMFMGLSQNVKVRDEVRAGSGGTGAGVGAGHVVLDSITFNEAVESSQFSRDRVLVVRPPVGETVLVRYRVTASIHMPFQLVHALQLLTPQHGELTLRVRSDFPTTVAALDTRVVVPLPLTTLKATVELGIGGENQGYEFVPESKEISWTIPQFTGGTEQVCRVKFSTATPMTSVTQREVGPFTMFFEIPQFSVTGLTLTSLRLEERSESYEPRRWLRNITQASSYVFR